MIQKEAALHVENLCVDFKTRKGSVRVEVLNADGYRVRGFSKDDAVAIKGDDLDHPVAWNEKSVADLPDGKYKLRLHLEKSEVFALSFVK